MWKFKRLKTVKTVSKKKKKRTELEDRHLPMSKLTTKLQ